MRQLLQDSDLGAEIRLCRLCTACHFQNPIPGEGPSTARVLIVGRNPGAQENKLNRPFIGPGGKLLNKHLSMMGLPRSSLGIINTANCHKQKDEAPTYEEYRSCVDNWLHKKVEFFSHSVVMLVCGNDAIRHVLNDPHYPSISYQKYNKLPDLFYRERRVIPIHHVGYLLRNPLANELFEKQTLPRVRSLLLQCLKGEKLTDPIEDLFSDGPQL